MCPPVVPSQPQRRTWLPALLLVGLTAGAYIPAMSGGFIWDDDDYVQDNLALRSLAGLGQIWFQPGTTRQYYPLVHTTYWLEYRLWGLDPTGYHVVNVILHALSAVLVWRLLIRLKVAGAWAAAALFALHPVHVESVAWITERKNVLSGAFYLSAAWAYLRCQEARSPRLYWAALFLFAAALLSKTVTCTLPAALLLVLWWKGQTPMRRTAVALVPFFALGVAMSGVTVWMERHSVGAWGPEWDLSLVERGLIAGRALWFYAAKLLVPLDLAFIYPRWEIDATAVWQYAYPVGALGVGALLWAFREHLGRGALIGVLFFAGTLTPALGFFNFYPMLYSFVADHFQYLASLGLLALVAASGHRTWTRLGRSAAGPVALAVALALCGLLTWQQGQVYADLETLWRDTLKKNAGAWIAHNNLANILKERGQLDQAIGHYRQALLLKPGSAQIHLNLADAHRARGEPAAAMRHYGRALNAEPDRVETYLKLGNALLGQNAVAEAIEHYGRALRLAPDLALAHSNLGAALAIQRRDAEAIEHYQRALQLNPDFAEAHNNLGRLLALRGQFAEAIEHYRRALQLKPTYRQARSNLASALQAVGADPRAQP